MRLIGAGLGRTGTASLRHALEQLTGGPCYHMSKLGDRPGEVEAWAAAARGERVDWQGLLDGYEAAVDWPAAGFWRELSEAFPDAPVLLSTRRSAEAWWASASQTVFQVLQEEPPPDRLANRAMMHELLATTFTPDWRDPAAAMAGYDRHNASVRAEVQAERLVEWQPGDGWEPLCRALRVPVPDEPFPHVNTTADFRQALDLEK
jgi:hypothetical protein